MSLPVADLIEWLGPEAVKLWATSFTVDELIAFAVAYRSIGSRLGSKNAPPVCLRFPRAGFRRDGPGSIPRAWLQPVETPAENPRPACHPKLMVSQTHEGHRLVVSTGNLARSDVSAARNLAVRFDVSNSFARQVVDWIKARPRKARALCLHSGSNGLVALSRRGNPSSYVQFQTLMTHCPDCLNRADNGGSWILAAPFWSPGTIKRLLRDYPSASVQAYFRSRGLWDVVGWFATQEPHSVSTKDVKAFTLGNLSGLQQWHHKVFAWRCCGGERAQVVLYVGSANASGG